MTSPRPWETTLAKVLPERYVDSLPSVEDLEAELGADDID